MIYKNFQSLSGYLLTTRSMNISRETILDLHSISFANDIPLPGWEEFTLETSKALIQEEYRGKYLYPIICRRSGTKLLLLSYNRKIVEYVLDKFKINKELTYFFNMCINVNSLVKKLTDTPDKYVLSFVHARVPAFGNSLRAISFYGNDISEASMFRENMGLMNFYACGLRKVVGEKEILRLSSDGFISFRLPNLERLVEVQDTITFLRNNYLLYDK